MVLEQNKYSLQIPGGAGCAQWLGETCEIDLPSQQDIEDSDVYDKYFKGTYLITHIYHHISQDYYTTNLEANKIRLNEAMK